MTKLESCNKVGVDVPVDAGRRCGNRQPPLSDLPVGETLVATSHEARAPRQALDPELGERASTRPQSSRRMLWLWVSAAFFLLVIEWTVLFTVARSAKIQSVPLATPGARP